MRLREMLPSSVAVELNVNQDSLPSTHRELGPVGVSDAEGRIRVVWTSVEDELHIDDDDDDGTRM